MNRPDPLPSDLDSLFIEKHLAGFPQEAATGRPIGEVIRFVDAVSRRPVDCPVTESIIENQRRSVGAHCLLLHRENTLVPVDVSATPIHDRLGGVVGAVLVAHDVTAARELSERLARLALYDHLTGLPNRTLFADRLDRAIVLAKRAGACFSLLYIDLDNFTAMYRGKCAGRGRYECFSTTASTE
jgi:predicted signal transduction protein with EAL and GGDEF domain